MSNIDIPEQGGETLDSNTNVSPDIPEQGGETNDPNTGTYIPRYCTIADVQALGVTDTVDNILASIQRSEDYIDLITQQRFSRDALTIVQDGTGDDTILLEAYPIISISSVNYTYGNWGPTYSSDLSDLVVDNEAGLLYNRRINWPEGERSITIVGVFGYAVVPSMIKQAAIQLAAAGGMTWLPLLGSRIKPIEMNYESESISGYSYSRKGTSMPLGKDSTGIYSVDAMLKQYKREPYMKGIGFRYGINANEGLNDYSVLRRVVGDD